MVYFPSERWTDKLFGNSVDNLDGDEPLYHTKNYHKILRLALDNKGANVGSIAFGSQDQNETLFETVKDYGIVLLTKLSGPLFPSDHIIVVPMDMKNGKPQDFWMLEIEEESYDGSPISNDLSGTVWKITILDVPFVSKVDYLLTDFYREKRIRGKKGYDAINKRMI